MDDLISRISLKQSIAVSAILKDKKTLEQIIDEEPSIDAVPVVRCKNCKHRYLDGMTWNCPFGLSGGEDFFCSYGSRMDERKES